ncbi:hypothetical protein [Brevibacillus brevis]|uniref:hypothetical protein n=1 Tax=Brevibacillus brevis TaxID=1393 RepID=UPI00165E76FE|nr:hypothetical protein [Brevibacillus brevis]
MLSKSLVSRIRNHSELSKYPQTFQALLGKVSSMDTKGMSSKQIAAMMDEMYKQNHNGYMKAQGEVQI